MEVSVYLHALSTLCPRKELWYLLVGKLVVSRASLDVGGRNLAWLEIKP
jgi:hypothetical protein